MSGLLWFSFGWFTANLLSLLTGIKPDQAKENLKAWWRLFTTPPEKKP